MKRFITWLSAVVLVSTVVACDKTETPPPNLGDVAIIVLDYFKEDAGKTADEAGNCTYAPESTGEVDDGGAGDGLPPGLTHGKAVMDTLSQTLRGIGGLKPVSNVDRADYGVDPAAALEVWGYGKHQVVVVGVDTFGFDTAAILKNVENTITALEGSKRAIKRFVVNMSFVIAPCDVEGWLSENLSPKEIIAAYLELLGRHPELTDLKKFIDGLDGKSEDEQRVALAKYSLGSGSAEDRQRLSASAFYGSSVLPSDKEQRERESLTDSIRNWVMKDPLNDGLARLGGQPGRQVIPVGAAGNGVMSGVPARRVTFRMPFAPAIWNSVVSVSAGDQGIEDYSNDGEMMLDGSTDIKLDKGTVRGSSFAAPRLSAQLARHMLTGGQSTCNGHVPTLGYANSAPPWSNKPFGSAASTICPAIQTGPLPTPSP